LPLFAGILAVTLIKAIQAADGDELRELCIEKSKDLLKDMKVTEGSRPVDDNDVKFSMFGEE
jgi:hypothetical protein